MLRCRVAAWSATWLAFLFGVAVTWGCGGDGAATVPTDRAPAGSVAPVPSSPGPAGPSVPAPAATSEPAATATTSVAPPTDAQARRFFRRLQRAVETGRVEEGELLSLRRWPLPKGLGEEQLSLTSGAQAGSAFRLERRIRSGEASQTVLPARGAEVRELASLVLRALDGRWTAAPVAAPAGKRLEVTVVAGEERRTVVLPLQGAPAHLLALEHHTEALVQRLLATGYRVGGPAAPQPPTSGKTMRKHVGDARMLADGTIVLTLRSDPTVDGVYTGPMRYTYAPSHPRYAAISKHVGPLEPDGPEVLVRPFPEDDDVEETTP